MWRFTSSLVSEREGERERERERERVTDCTCMCVIHSMIFTICFVHAYITICMYGCTWSFMQIGKCVYLTKKLEFVTIRTQVSGLWSQGEEVQCGAVVNDTRVCQNTHTHTHCDVNA